LDPLAALVNAKGVLMPEFVRLERVMFRYRGCREHEERRATCDQAESGVPSRMGAKSHRINTGVPTGMSLANLVMS
jgi:hypothetical protein